MLWGGVLRCDVYVHVYVGVHACLRYACACMHAFAHACVQCMSACMSCNAMDACMRGMHVCM